MTPGSSLSWTGVLRLGVVQAAIGAVVVLMTSTLNRVMAVELGLAAAVPGALIALHFAVQFFFRPKLGHDSDRSSRRTGTILRGMVLLATAGTGAAAAVALIATHRWTGLLLATLAFAGIGIGVSAAGTPLLALLAQRVPPERRARAAAVVWLMMITGFVVTTMLAGRLLDPFSFPRLVAVTGGIGTVACLAAGIALAGLESVTASGGARPAPGRRFDVAMRLAWREPAVRRFATFVFVAMLGYSAQDLILEPFAGIVFGLTPGASTLISSLHQGGMLAGMLVAAAFAVRFGGLARWAAGGCLASAAAFAGLALTPAWGSLAALKLAVASLGLANGAFAIGAVGSMMVRARGDDAGLRMGVFGAAQALAYAIGGFLGAAGSDLARSALGSSAAGYVAVFAGECVLFVIAGGLVLADPAPDGHQPALATSGDGETLLAVLH